MTSLPYGVYNPKGQLEWQLSSYLTKLDLSLVEDLNALILLPVAWRAPILHPETLHSWNQHILTVESLYQLLYN